MGDRGSGIGDRVSFFGGQICVRVGRGENKTLGVTLGVSK